LKRVSSHKNLIQKKNRPWRFSASITAAFAASEADKTINNIPWTTCCAIWASMSDPESILVTTSPGGDVSKIPKIE
jgi:hypothetical protein